MDRDGDGRSRWFNFFAAESKRLIGYVCGRFHNINEMDAEDIVSEVMLGIFTRPDASGPVENLTAYVYKSLNNKSIDYQRSRPKTLSLQSCIDDDGEMPLMNLLSERSSSGMTEAERNEFMRRLAQAISRLEPRQRAVFVATELNGRPFKALSQEWREPMGTLLSRKCRAVKALREMLKDLDEFNN